VTKDSFLLHSSLVERGVIHYVRVICIGLCVYLVVGVCFECVMGVSPAEWWGDTPEVFDVFV